MSSGPWQAGSGSLFYLFKIYIFLNLKNCYSFIFGCNTHMRDLSSRTQGSNLRPLEWKEAWGPNHWTVRDVPGGAV